MNRISRSERETLQIAKEIAQRLSPGWLVLLSGELGAGKTRFVKGLAEGLGIREHITSPTFTIVNQYQGDTTLFHVDLYRLSCFPEEDISLEEMLKEGIVAVEWWERDREFFSSYRPRVEVYMKVLDENSREIELRWME